MKLQTIVVREPATTQLVSALLCCTGSSRKRSGPAVRSAWVRVGAVGQGPLRKTCAGAEIWRYFLSSQIL